MTPPETDRQKEIAQEKELQRAYEQGKFEQRVESRLDHQNIKISSLEVTQEQLRRSTKSIEDKVDDLSENYAKDKAIQKALAEAAHVAITKQLTKKEAFIAFSGATALMITAVCATIALVVHP